MSTWEVCSALSVAAEKAEAGRDHGKAILLDQLEVHFQRCTPPGPQFSCVARFLHWSTSGATLCRRGKNGSLGNFVPKPTRTVLGDRSVAVSRFHGA